MGALKFQFYNELRKAKALVKKIYTGKRPISELPTALQHFVAQSGCLSLNHIYEAQIEWRNSALKFSKKGNWKPIECIQHNFLPDPIRLVYMKTKIFGLISIEAFDSFRHGFGGMVVKLANLLKLVNAKGIEIDQSELVTILAETMILPDYALQTYIHWEEINLHAVLGTIHYHGLKASGTFYFNENFQISKFETNDRYYTAKNGKFINTKWTATCANYRTENNITFPTEFAAFWNLPEGDFNYFKGQIGNIKYLH